MIISKQVFLTVYHSSWKQFERTQAQSFARYTEGVFDLSFLIKERVQIPWLMIKEKWNFNTEYNNPLSLMMLCWLPYVYKANPINYFSCMYVTPTMASVVKWHRNGRSIQRLISEVPVVYIIICNVLIFLTWNLSNNVACLDCFLLVFLYNDKNLLRICT